MTQAFSLAGKVALVTGGTHGLGMAIATGLAKSGARIVINDVFEDKLSSAVQEYLANDIEVAAYAFDVTKEEQVKEGIAKIEAEVGGIDILVNNAGIIKRTPALEMEVSDFRQVIDIDLVGPFIMSKYVAKGMVERGQGKIINMCSMMSELGRNSVSAYASAKGGLKMLTRNLATEWAKYNIQVNGIGPGYFATSQTAPIRVDGHPFNEFILNRTPAGKWGDPSDLAGTAVFLSSAASNFVNGQVIYVDGGILATIGKPHGEE
ncbi:gluconate 5-dehydrogenase [Flammeovirga sp. SJP92]|uniref:gluconate 5-dehydrogenase n=1 Tax=Flammeovirga sp. SJP92 TaxID=1775430 RepID=UPI000788A8EE|nr:gluconate 5-dehydrogenase [Flammeovirga sp. SJP92]KXX71601.1 gluconate 5-dehydrogenase [Flammeovirga sp. SJP92]